MNATVRRAAWALGAPARWALIGLIHAYRAVFSGWLGGQCRFYPSCSHYGEEAVRIHGAIKGSALAAWRIARCGPFTRGGVDHVPPRRSKPHASYDAVLLKSRG
jgi:putative membrane protein insertion efficiency factor